MKISQAFENFEAALKVRTAAEIASLSARGDAAEGEAASDLRQATHRLQDATLGLMNVPATGPADLVIKARAIRCHFPNGIEIERAATLGGPIPVTDASFAVAILDRLVRDLLALAG